MWNMQGTWLFQEFKFSIFQVNLDDSGIFSTPQKKNAFKLFAQKMTPKSTYSGGNGWCKLFCSQNKRKN